MSQPLPEATGSRRSPDTPIEIDGRIAVEHKLALVVDCMRHALESVGLNRPGDADWSAVARHINAAGPILLQAEFIATHEADAARNGEPRPIWCINPLDADPFLPSAQAVAEIGGES